MAESYAILPLFPLRRCARCGIEKPYDDFRKKKKSGYTAYCRPCLTEYSRQWRALHNPPNQRLPKNYKLFGMRKCRVCGKIKPVDQFPWKNKPLDKRSAKCQPCLALHRQLLEDERKRRNSTGTKYCHGCETYKPIDEFRWCNKAQTMRRSLCRLCEGQRTRWGLRYLYGITPDDYDRMLTAQGGVCAICGRPERERKSHRRDPGPSPLSVDHDHETGVVRGLLCGRCNRGIGFLFHDPQILQSAIDYLRQSHQ